MSVNNISPINQKIIEANKEKVSGQQPQVDLSQKPDTISFGAKKVARNTGIGAIIGAISGSINSLLKNNVKKTNQVQPATQVLDKEITSEYFNQIIGALEKLKQGVQLTSQEAKILNGQEWYQHLGIKYMIDTNSFGMADSFIEQYQEALKKQLSATEAFKNMEEIVMPQASIGLIPTLQDLVKDYLNGKSENKQFIDMLIADLVSTNDDNIDFDELLNEVLKKQGYLDEFKSTGKVPFINTVSRCISERLPSCAKYRYMNWQDEKAVASCGIQKTYEAFKDNYLAQAGEQLKQAGESIKPQLTSKEILKSTGIGAAIVGGFALVGSIIYNAVKNKKAEQ